MFARHETFAPRFGWVTKGFAAAQEDPRVFLSDDAPFRLGVGKNMARAIRYWCHAFKVLKDVPQQGGRSFGSEPTEIGRALLGRDGWDPYLENAASLWLLHWLLISSPCTATAWRFAFTQFPDREFTAERLLAGLSDFTAREYPTARAAVSSLRKDVNCILRMYAASSVRTGDLSEETLQCPFADLGLVRQAGDEKSFLFDLGEKPELSEAVIVFACLDFAASTAPESRTISASRLLLEPGAPGMAFKLTQSTLCAAIEVVAEQTRAVKLADTAGLVQMAFRAEPRAVAHELLADFFSISARSAT